MKIKLEQWDGKEVRYLEKVYKQEKSDKFIANIIILIRENGLVQNAATWLLKRALEDGSVISQSQIENIYKNVDKLDSWESKLHILQIMQYMKVSKKVKAQLERFLRDNLTDSNKFVRAWSYNGLYELCLVFPEYKDEVKNFFEMAMRDEAPSVRSRIRNIMKGGF